VIWCRLGRWLLSCVPLSTMVMVPASCRRFCVRDVPHQSDIFLLEKWKTDEQDNFWLRNSDETNRRHFLPKPGCRTALIMVLGGAKFRRRRKPSYQSSTTGFTIAETNERPISFFYAVENAASPTHPGPPARHDPGRGRKPRAEESRLWVGCGYRPLSFVSKRKGTFIIILENHPFRAKIRPRPFINMAAETNRS
jgi:hypothetical protein